MSKSILQIYVLILLANFIGVGCDKKLNSNVKLPNGNTVIGIEQTSLYTGRQFVEFRGIPYAKPPVGSLRFKAPIPYDEKWTEPRQATEFGMACPQDDVLSEPSEEGHIEEMVQVMGNEDCLTINVASPLEGGQKYPVAVWINGGSFLYESGDAYGGRKFLEHDIVFVTFNHRLGVLGFLNTEDGAIQGNMGLKDQVLALKWVKENIHSFGGDPDMVTLLGVNSGAVSAHLHLLSPMSQGLFHRAILQSGSALAPWAITRNPGKVAQNYHSWINCTTAENVTIPMVECLMNLDADTIVRKQSRLTEWYIDPLVPVGPSIETEGDETKFLAEDPYKIIQSGNFWAKDKVSLMTGVNSHEGLLHSWDLVHHKMLYKILNMEWQRAVPITLLYRETALHWRNVTDSIFNYYFTKPSDTKEDEDEKDDEEGSLPTHIKDKIKNLKRNLIGDNFHQFEELTQMYSDRYFYVALHKTAKLHGKCAAPVYLYWFDYQGEQSGTQFSGYNDTVVGVSHYDQIQYMFNTPYFNETESEADIEFGKSFVAGIVRFITVGEPPAGGWIPVTKGMVEGTVPLIYNRIGTDKEAYQITERFTKNVEFWDTLPILEYGRERSDFPEFDELLKADEVDQNDGDQNSFTNSLSRDDIEHLLQSARVEL